MTNLKAALCHRHIIQVHVLSGERLVVVVETFRRDKALLQGAQEESDPMTTQDDPRAILVPMDGRPVRRCHSRPPL